MLICCCLVVVLYVRLLFDFVIAFVIVRFFTANLLAGVVFWGVRDLPFQVHFNVYTAFTLRAFL